MNLTDEGLREMAGNLCYYGHEHPTPNCPTCEPIFTALKQVRDAANKETIEKAAKIVDGYACNCSDSCLGEASADIRQMDGGK